MKKKKNGSFKRALNIFKYIRPYRWAFITGMILLFISSSLFMIFPGAAGEMANVANGQGKFNLTVKDFGWIFLIILIVQGIMSYFRTILFAYVAEKGMADVRKAVFDKLITLDMAFLDEHRKGELTSYVTTDVEKLQTTFAITLAEFFRQLITLGIGLVIISWLAPKLSLIMLATFPVIVVLAIFFGRYIKKLSRKRQDILAESNAIIDDALTSFHVVKSFVNEWFESRKYGQSIDHVVTVSLRFARIKGIFFVFVIMILFGGIFFILWQGAILVEQNEMAVGDLFSFVMYTALMGGAIAGLGNFYTQISSAVGATERILDILDRESEVSPTKVVLEQKDFIQGNIIFDNIHFNYPSRSDVEVLSNLNLTIDAGQKIALVGQSGAGKSTIAQLLLKFYQPNGGQIMIDGKDLNEMDILKYRKQVAVVPQEIMLLGGTIYDNIAYGNPGAPKEEVMKAAEMSNCLEFILKFPEGMQTKVGDRGVRLSGGQRQRIAIARAILTDPKILILDEATSSLDAESEKLVQDALEISMQGRTSVIIAHRLSTIKDVDCIYVLKRGIIVESGTHDELILRSDSIYNSLLKLQMDVSV